jgi:hypothetical protein
MSEQPKLLQEDRSEIRLVSEAERAVWGPTSTGLGWNQDAVDDANRRAAPLRLIVGTGRNDEGLPREWLECGHIVGVKQDAFGATAATRRRCHKCKKGRPQDFDPKEPR